MSWRFSISSKNMHPIPHTDFTETLEDDASPSFVLEVMMIPLGNEERGDEEEDILPNYESSAEEGPKVDVDSKVNAEEDFQASLGFSCPIIKYSLISSSRSPVWTRTRWAQVLWWIQQSSLQVQKHFLQIKAHIEREIETGKLKSWNNGNFYEVDKKDGG